MNLLTVFLTVLQKSLFGAICILFVLLIRQALKHFPKVFSYVLWGIVGIRLLFDISFESVFSLMQFVPQKLKDFNAGQIATPPTVFGGDFVAMPTADTGNQTVASQLSNTDTVQSHIGVLQTLSIIWLLVFVGFLLHSIYRLLKVRAELKENAITALPEEHRMPTVYEVTGLSDAFVFGIIKPAIYLPPDLPKREKELIILHERTHIKRRDYLFKMLAWVIVCIHWFNPLVWLAFHLFVRDMEMSCDESVMKHLQDGSLSGKKAYSHALLSMAGNASVPSSSNTLFFGETNVKQRIKNILSYKKRTAICSVALVAVIGLAAIGLLSSPKENEESQSPLTLTASPTPPVIDSIVGSGVQGAYKQSWSVWTDKTQLQTHYEAIMTENRAMLETLFTTGYPSVESENAALITDAQDDGQEIAIYCNRNLPDFLDLDGDGLEDSLVDNEEHFQIDFGNGDRIEYAPSVDIHIASLPYYFSAADITADGTKEMIFLFDLGYNGGEGGYGLVIFTKEGDSYTELPLPDTYSFEESFPMNFMWNGETAFFTTDNNTDCGLATFTKDEIAAINAAHGMPEITENLRDEEVGRVDALGGFTFIYEDGIPVLMTKQYVSGFGGHIDQIGYLLYKWKWQEGNWMLEASFVLV